MTQDAARFIEKAAVALNVPVPDVEVCVQVEASTSAAIAVYMLILKVFKRRNVPFIDDVLDIVANACKEESMYGNAFPMIVLNLYLMGDLLTWRNRAGTRRMLKQLGFGEVL